MKFGYDSHGNFRSFRGTFVNDNPPPTPGAGGGPSAWEKEFGEGAAFDPAKMHAALENARRVETQARRDADKAKRDLETATSTGKTAMETLEAKVAEMQSGLDAAAREKLEGITRAAVEDEARKEGAIYPDTIYALISGELEVDQKTGAAKNTAAVLKAFKASHGQLFTVARTNARDDPSKSETEQKSTGAFDRQVRGMFGAGRSN